MSPLGACCPFVALLYPLRFCFGPSFTPSGFAPKGQLVPPKGVKPIVAPSGAKRKPQLVFPPGQRTSPFSCCTPSGFAMPLWFAVPFGDNNKVVVPRWGLRRAKQYTIKQSKANQRGNVKLCTSL